MLIAGFPAGAWGTNCYLVAPAAGEECVIIDPGHQAAQGVEETLRKHRLKPVAVVLTHGHIDHVASVVPVCGAHGVPAWIHPEDQAMLADPLKGISAETAAFFGGKLQMREPKQVRSLDDGAELDLAGLKMTVDHTPGHTGGSVMFRAGAEEGGRLVLSGDTLFAGAIGRTDLPGGDHRSMLTSLRQKVLTLADDTVVLPGHGPTTTIGRERVSNPYLLQLGDSAPAAPHRGL